MPAIALLWFAFSSQLALWHGGALPVDWLLAGVVFVAALAFLFPAFGATLVGGLWDALMAFGRWW